MGIAVQQPTGARACCAITKSSGASNRWIFAIECRGEINCLHENDLDPALSEAEHEDLRARVTSLMKKAAAGKVTFTVRGAGRNPEARTISMQNCEFMYELRPQPEGTMRFGQRVLPPRVARLYCAEPVVEDAAILGLHLATKSSGRDVDSEQNAAILVAASRADLWDYQRRQIQFHTHHNEP